MTEVQEYVSRRNFGALMVSAINEGTGRYPVHLVDKSGAKADLPKSVALEPVIGFHVLLIQSGPDVILVDAGFDDPDSKWGRKFAREWSTTQRTPGLAEALLPGGPDQVTHLVITHAHFDHVAGLAKEEGGNLVPRFPNARVYVGRPDYEMVTSPASPDSAAEDIAARLKVVESAGLLTLVDSDLEIVSGISLFRAPGESPGHSVVRICSEGETLLAVGDLFHYPIEVERPDLAAPWVDHKSMVESRERILAEALAGEAVIVFTHSPFPPWGRIVKTATGYRWEAI